MASPIERHSVEQSARVDLLDLTVAIDSHQALSRTWIDPVMRRIPCGWWRMGVRKPPNESDINRL